MINYFLNRNEKFNFHLEIAIRQTKIVKAEEITFIFYLNFSHIDLNQMDANENLIQIEKNDYINLLSAQLVLNVISNSIKKLNEESSNAKEKQADATENCSNTVKVKKHFNTSRWFSIPY